MTSRPRSRKGRPSCASGPCCSAQDPYNSPLMSNRRLCVLGAGNIGRALLSGLLRSGTRNELLSVGESHPAARDALTRELGIAAVTDNAAAIAGCAVVVLAVKPQDAAAVLKPLAAELTASRA